MSATGALAAAQNAEVGEVLEAVVQAEGVVQPIAAAEGEASGEKVVETAQKPGEESAQSAALTEKEREEAIARVKEAAALPPALREKLAALVETSGGRAHVPLEACLALLEASLPDFLRESSAEAARPPHPGGEVFFSGSQEEISDAEAEEIAQRQLQRSGLLRGQRVRVGD